ncbi:sensor domain-containing protein [Gorillibacterium massiliense]|uniref:sensor domain-containing protein n=1 Tax=Gorillibacterium massiliense TaxID=1280390 RepID=UPI0004B4E2CD|nr:sensor domain-containing protein [Gorillibacterium massiliense]
MITLPANEIHAQNPPKPRKAAFLYKIVYLLLSFPLGIFYFVFLVTGLSVSVGLMITLIGFPLLVIVLTASRGFIHLERQLARPFLSTALPEKETVREELKLPLFQQIWSMLKNPRSYTDMLCLFLRFPLGIINFVFVVTFLSVTIACISSPLVYYILEQTLNIDIFENSLFHLLNLPYSTWTEAWCYTAVGLLLIPVTVKVVNGLTFLTAHSLAPFSRD